MSIRVLLVDDHPVVRAGLSRVLAAEADIDVVGEADAGEHAISLARMLQPDVIVTDLLLPDLDGVAVTERVRAELPGIQVLILTSVDEEDAAVVRAVRAGAIGFIVKTADISVLVQAIRSSALGQVYLSPRAAARLMQEMRAPKKPALLTDRELQVLREIAIGRTNKEIARSLDIAQTTVKSHVGAILDKLGVDSRTQAALHGLRSAMFSADQVAG
jgi:NarL family two-component system response regulator LiaR